MIANSERLPELLRFCTLWKCSFSNQNMIGGRHVEKKRQHWSKKRSWVMTVMLPRIPYIYHANTSTVYRLYLGKNIIQWLFVTPSLNQTQPTTYLGPRRSPAAATPMGSLNGKQLETPFPADGRSHPQRSVQTKTPRRLCCSSMCSISIFTKNKLIETVYQKNINKY